MPNIHAGDQHARQEVARSNSQKSGLFAFALVLLLIGLLLLTCYLVFVQPMFNIHPPVRTQFEMKQLEQSVEQYKIELGAYPPGNDLEQIKKHINDVEVLDQSLATFEDVFPESVSSLDERELLHLWLSGAAWSGINKTSSSSFVFFDFTESQLVDTDNDGWPEYVDHLGNYFLLREGEIWIHYAESDEQQSLREIESRHLKQYGGAQTSE